MAKKRIKYFASLNWKEKDGTEHDIQTQLYQVGLYVVMDGASSVHRRQMTADPKKFARTQKKHIEQLKADGLEYSTGMEKTVSDDSGLWEEEE